MIKKIILTLLIGIVSIFMIGCDFGSRPLKEKIEVYIKSK